MQSDRERELPASHKARQAERMAAALLARRARAEEQAAHAEQRGDADEAARRRVIAARLAARAERLAADAAAFRVQAESEPSGDSSAP